MSDELPECDDPIVALIDTHWRPAPGQSEAFLADVRALRRRFRRQDVVALAALAAAVLLFAMSMRDVPLGNDSSVWLDGTSVLSAASPYDGEFVAMQRMFLDGAHP